ncbi:MAG: DUF5063 domain-containing protein [Bacteroides sp.]|nr:DUF5063 domain-containing protein [Bacteroides sp.]MDE6262061.1 DUF5063 domain-containing protein [Muribaculaceae bacterium]MBD5293766.1 DUF5063 domain-containing protein [Bacteroides sp.]MBD5351687.1 DUF5063 domain-containing protein [Bacteroides sp.]MBD5362805.1 DUF5063 domain-containing protein [Bacteroides sp.]
MATNRLSNNQLAVIALANEFCQAIELAPSVAPNEFIEKMVRLLPRIYISVTDLSADQYSDPEYALDAMHLDEAYYNQVRDNIAGLLGEDDSYLETFHEDMKYSDTPIAATVSESLADIFQVMYDFVEDVKNSELEQQLEYFSQLRDDFSTYWGQTLCNVMRPLNELSNKDFSDEDEF